MGRVDAPRAATHRSDPLRNECQASTTCMAATPATTAYSVARP
jgi:hypothetical protein